MTATKTNKNHITQNLNTNIRAFHKPSGILVFTFFLINITWAITNKGLATEINEVEKQRVSVSYGQNKKSITDNILSNIIEQNKNSIFSDQVIGKAIGQSREEVQLKKSTTNKSHSTTLSNTNSSSAYLINSSSAMNYEFGIYDAHTYFKEDFDEDGYFQTFSVTFDADIYSYGNDLDAEVYAELYLSKDGVNWEHYYTTDNFLIHADTDKDEHEVITTLMDGYRANQYSVLIDLYQVGYDDIVATVSSDDLDTLYALPLESNDYNQVYVETVQVHHGGNLSLVTLMLLLLTLTLRVKLVNKV